MHRLILLLMCLHGTVRAAEGRYVAVGVQAGAIARLGPADGATDPGDRALGIGVDLGWHTDWGWPLVAMRVEDQQFGADLGWQIHPLWGVAPVIGARLGLRRARRGWRTGQDAGDTVRTALTGGLDVGVRYLDHPGWLVQVLVRPGMTLLTHQVTTVDDGAVDRVPGVQAPDPFGFAEVTVALQIGHSW